MTNDKGSSAAVSVRIAGVSDVLEAIAKDGALALVIGAPAAEAISKVISGAASIPEAWLRSKARAIDADQDARERISDSVAAHAAVLAPKDQALVDRATIRWVGKAIREQENLEAVAAQAAADLRDNPSTAEESPTDDFINSYVDRARLATSEEMRDLFARILVGEIREPGRFTLAGLHLFAIMDRNLAALIQRYASMTWDRKLIPNLPSMKKGVGLTEIRSLESFGLIATGLNIPLVATNNISVIPYPERLIQAHFDSASPGKLAVSILTPLGTEVFGLVEQPPEGDLILRVFEDLKHLPQINSLACYASKKVGQQSISVGPALMKWSK